MNPTVEVLPDLPALVQHALILVVDRIQEAIRQRGQCTIALAGGNTPKPLYEAIARQDLSWEHLHVFWGDERYVAPDHPDSNQGMARRAWLDQIPIPATNIHPMPTATGNPIVDAQDYEAQLRNFFQVTAPDFPQLDIVLLGMGDDGHTASLFPHTPALKVGDRLITVGHKGEERRLTFTLPLINHSRCVIFLVAGANKQAALQAIFTQGDEQTYPARSIQPRGEFIWLLDAAAGEIIQSLTR